MIRTLLVDADARARAALRALLEHEPGFEIVGECATGADAAAGIVALRPDLVFLEARLPDLDGFAALEAASRQHLPRVVFVTALDRHALRAFELHALDYLVKPLARERFAETLRRVRRAFVSPSADTQPRRLGQLLEAHASNGSANGNGAHGRVGVAEPPLKRLVVGERGRFMMLPIEEVEWLSAAANYVEVHARGRTFLIRSTLQSLEDRLDPAGFARIHRSTVVNVAHVENIHPNGNGDYDVAMKDGTVLRMSRSHRERVLR